ncbi:MAG: sulfate adenylyltransferase subunit 2 [Euryarchaeota archaeon]|jgi:sulfate adenylyltransferase subunit 2|nr:sulfate adenylyltransferase subunit 2 [Euryarchaeota archaeon]
MKRYYLNHLQKLEAESIFVIREVAAQFERPVLLFSGGKDSIVLGILSRKAFAPAKIPYPLLHIDTGHNFPEVLLFRDAFVKYLDVRLLVGSVQKSIDTGRVKDETGKFATRNYLQSITLLDTLHEHKFDAAIGGGRRDEEKSRAKERFFSHRNDFGQWDPKNQRPELWDLYNGRKHHGEHFRVFPLSNWTELDIWQYILKENIQIPSIYFSHTRDCIIRDTVIYAYSDYLHLDETERKKVQSMTVRFRTVGDMTCTGAVHSDARTVEEIVQEVAAYRISERGNRADDRRSENSLEDRKKEGYF